MWIIPPPPPGASRRERNEHRREVELTERELKDVWVNACLTTWLVEPIPPPGVMLQPPVVCSIDLDSEPARFTVKLRRGQVAGDFHRKADRLALAFRVPAVEIVPSTLDPTWISIRLLEDLRIEYVEVPPVPVLRAEPRPVTAGGPPRRRPERAGAGGPPSLRLRPHRVVQRSGESSRTQPEVQRSGESSRAQPESGAVNGFAAIARWFVEFWRLLGRRARTEEPVGGDSAVGRSEHEQQTIGR